uniref:TTC5_OB domain-containing protein n=1 Tax=Globodera pallida TaxID=36090 RepID=A0A183CII7_GLOPA
MEHFRVRVKQLERRRIEYFLFTPDSSLEQYSRDIREGASDLLQEIPLNISVDTKQYLIGKILNIMPDFEVKCEEFLEQSLRANSTRTDAWLELGQCVWKRGDLVKAHICFKEAVEREHSPKALCLLSAALRALSNRCVDGGQRVQMLNEAIRNCQEALLRHRKSYAFAYYSLANTFLARFFALQQSSGQDLFLALDAFATALKTPVCCANALATNAANADTTQHQQQQQLPFINPDLHLSYGLALYYGQFYAKALAQFRRALTIEPHFGQAKRQFDSARTFLCALRNGLRRKGNIAKRRLRSLVDTFPKSASIDERRLLEKHVGGMENPARTLAICSNLSELPSSSCNESAAETIVSLAVRCVGFVNNDDKIPCVIICVDRTAAVVALTVYNCSTKFGALIGDTFTVLQPNLIRLRWKELELNDEAEAEKLDKNSDGTTDNDGEQQLLLIRVTNPQCQLLKNGRPLTALECAFASMQIETQQK